MSFQELENQTWTGSDGTVAIAANTDISIDGSSRKITWTATSSATVTITFDSIDLSEWEELSLYVLLPSVIDEEDVFSITIDGEDFTFNRNQYYGSKWNHIVIDCSGMGTVTTMVFTCLIADLVLFVDYIGVRKVGYDMDIDVIEALKDHINLDYDVATTLSADAAVGDAEISLTSSAYMTDTSILEIDDGAGTVETVELINRSGELNTALTHAFSAGAEVRVICPVRSEDYDELEPDPICGIKIFDLSADRREDRVNMKNGFKIKEYLGNLGVMIYIDCNSKKKLLQMAREYNKRYGREFEFLLDGERVDIYMESDLFADTMIGNNPRMAYYYRIEPQPYLVMNSIIDASDTLTLEVIPPVEG